MLSHPKSDKQIQDESESPAPNVLADINSLIREIRSYGKKAFFDDMGRNDIATIQAKIGEFTKKIEQVRDLLNANKTFASKQNLSNLYKALTLLNSVEDKLSLLAKACSEQFILPAADILERVYNAIWNAKNTIEMEASARYTLSPRVNQNDLINCLIQECNITLRNVTAQSALVSRLQFIKASLRMLRNANGIPVKNLLIKQRNALYKCHKKIMENLGFSDIQEKLENHRREFLAIETKDDVVYYLESLKSLYPASLDDFPAEIKQNIVFHSRKKERIILRKVGSEYKDAVDYEYASNKKSYFAVGKSVALYEEKSFYGFGYYSNHDFVGDYSYRSYESKRENIPQAEILNCLNSGTIHLFDKLGDATNFAHYHSERRFNSNLDWFESYRRRPIFVVNISNPLIYKHATGTMSDDWVRNSPCPPKVKVLPIPGYVTPSSNIETIFFSQLYDTDYPFFGKRNEINKLFVEFRSVWDSALAFEKLAEADATTCARAAVIELFKTYSSPFLSKITRKHHKRVQEIIEDLPSQQTLDDILYYLNSKLSKAEDIPGINREGHYYKMLEFAIRGVKEFMDLEQLPTLRLYLYPPQG